MHKRRLSLSAISGTESESESESDTESESEWRHAYYSIKDDKNVPYQPPHPQHIPSSLEIAQANARIADQKVKLAELDIKSAELNAKLNELTRDKLLLTQQCDAAVQAARNDLSFIAGKFIPEMLLSDRLMYLRSDKKGPYGYFGRDLSILPCVWVILFPMDVDPCVKNLSCHGFQYTSIVGSHSNHY